MSRSFARKNDPKNERWNYYINIYQTKHSPFLLHVNGLQIIVPFKHFFNHPITQGVTIRGEHPGFQERRGIVDIMLFSLESTSVRLTMNTEATDLLSHPSL